MGQTFFMSSTLFNPHSPGVPYVVPSWKTLKVKLCEDKNIIDDYLLTIDYIMDIIRKYIY